MKIAVCILIFTLFGCQPTSKELPILSYKIDDEGNKIEYSITYNGFTNHLGQSFSTHDIDGKVIIANFFFTRCPSICPPMRVKLIDIAETFENEDDFLIVSHTIDPENDTVEVLKEYAESTAVPSEKWLFVRSSEENTKRQAHHYMTNFKPNEDGTDFYHSSYVAMVDKNQQIRGFYNILVDKENERLTEDIAALLD